MRFDIIKIIICTALVLSFVTCKKSEENAAAAHDAEISEGIDSAEVWIQLIDDQKYPESWNTASALFKKSITAEKWKEVISTARASFGKISTRSLATKEYFHELPGVPDGEYVLLKYRSSFEKKKSSIEIITVMKDPDNRWRGAGYTIK